MPADRHALPALERLTADVAAAMRAAEAADAAAPCRARWWRRTPPLAVTLLALAVPSAVALHATTSDGHGDPSVPDPGLRAAQHHLTFAAFRCDGGRAVGAAMLLTGAASVGRCSATPMLTARRRPLTAPDGATVARDARGRIVFRCALPGVGALSRRDGFPAAAVEPRPCA